MRPSFIFAWTILVGFCVSATAQTNRENAQLCSTAEDPDVRISACTALIESGRENRGTESHAYNNRGTAYRDKKDYDRAIDDFNRALTLNPKDAQAFNNRGNTYRDKGDYERAIEDYSQALRLNTKNAGILTNRGNAYADKGDFNRAIDDYSQALRIDPSFYFALNGRGNAHAGKKEYDRAIEDYNKALWLNPKFFYAFNGRGSAHYQKKEYERAIWDYDQALSFSPNDPQILTNRGNAYQAKGDYDRAIQDYDQALRFNPHSTEALNGRRSAYSAKGISPQAMADYEHVTPSQAASEVPSFCNEIEVQHPEALRQACEFVRTLRSRLPNFVCDQTTSRYERRGLGKFGNKPVDVVTAHVIYENGHEHFSDVRVNGESRILGVQTLMGQFSTGEFGNNLIYIFSPESHPVYRFVGEDQWSSHAAFVYQFQVSKKNNKGWLLETNTRRTYPELRGKLWVDQGTYQILRYALTPVAEPGFPLINVELDMNYENLPLGDGTAFVLPVRSEINSCHWNAPQGAVSAQADLRAIPESGNMTCNHNVLVFRNCHKFAAKSRIITDPNQDSPK